jgi:uncharacterized protein
MHGSLALDLLLGLGLGYLSGTFGITGGVIAVPILGFLGFGQHLAQGTSLVSSFRSASWHFGSTLVEVA